MADPNFTTRVRVGGSGFTIFTFGQQPIAFCQQASYTSPQPVGQGVSAIQPLDEPYPIELITPAAAGMGQIVLNMFELFGSGGVASKVWDRLGLSLGGSNASPFPGGGTPENASTNFNITGPGKGGLFAGAVDIVDIFIRQAQAEPSQLNVTKIIRPLSAKGAPGSTIPPYTEEYHGCVITNVADGEQIAIGTMEILKQITINFRYVTRNGKPSAAFQVRDNPLSA